MLLVIDRRRLNPCFGLFVSDVMKRSFSPSAVDKRNGKTVSATGCDSAAQFPKVRRTSDGGASCRKFKLSAASPSPSPIGDRATIKTPSSLGTRPDVMPHPTTAQPCENDLGQPSASRSAVNPPKPSKNDIVSRPCTNSSGVKPHPVSLRYGSDFRVVPNVGGGHRLKLRPSSEQLTPESTIGRVRPASSIMSPSPAFSNSGRLLNSKPMVEHAAGSLNTRATPAISNLPKNVGIRQPGAVIAGTPVYYGKPRPQTTAVSPSRRKESPEFALSADSSTATPLESDARARVVPDSVEKKRRKKKARRKLENKDPVTTAPELQRVAGEHFQLLSCSIARHFCQPNCGLQTTEPGPDVFYTVAQALFKFIGWILRLCYLGSVF